VCEQAILAKSMAKPVRRTLLLWLFCWPALLVAQTNDLSGSRYPPNRYLLVVETSRAMQHRSDQMAQTIQELLGSALARQARRGDSLGVWTFNEDLYTGVLPLQEWTPEQQKPITERVVGFLRAQKFEKKSKLDKVLLPLSRLVRNLPFLTVILVCVGDEEVHGTPYDQRINDFFQNWRQQQLDARTPFVVVLRAQGGRFVDCSMNPTPWPVELPALPKELFVARPAPGPAAGPPPKHPAPVVPPLIVIGKKHEPAPAITNAAPIETKPSTSLAITSNLAPQSLSNPQTTLVEQSTPPAQASAAQTGETSKPIAIASSNPAVAPIPSSTAAASQVAQQPVAAPTAPKLPSAEPIAPAPTTPAASPPSPAKSTTPEAQAPAEPARSDMPDPHKLNGSSLSGAPQASALPVNVASATPTRARSDMRMFLIGGCACALIGVGLAAFWVWRRRARPPVEVSLITQSIDRRDH
jgi:hypothetical protein